jgi:hypothetical protein
MVVKIIIAVCVIVAVAGVCIGYWMKHHKDDYFD